MMVIPISPAKRSAGRKMIIADRRMIEDFNFMFLLVRQTRDHRLRPTPTRAQEGRILH